MVGNGEKKEKKTRIVEDSSEKCRTKSNLDLSCQITAKTEIKVFRITVHKLVLSTQKQTYNLFIIYSVLITAFTEVDYQPGEWVPLHSEISLVPTYRHLHQQLSRHHPHEDGPQVGQAL